MTVEGSLASCGFEGDCKVSGVGVCDLDGRREAEHVGGLVFAAEGFVEATEGRVVGQQNLNVAGQADGEAGAVEKARQTGPREVFFEAGRWLDRDH